MKILLTTHQFFPEYTAGTEVLVRSVAHELVKRGHVVCILTGHPSSADLCEDNRFDEYDFDGIHVYRFHHAYTPMAGQKSMIEIGYDNQLAAKYFEQLLGKLKPDIVHFFHLNRLGTSLIEHAVNAGIPCYMTPTDFWAICPTGQLVLVNGKMCSGPSEHAGNCAKHFAQNIKKGFIGGVVKWLPTASADFLVRLGQSEIMPPFPQQIELKALGSRLKKNIARLNQLSKIISPNSFMTEKLLEYGVLPNSIVQLAFGIDMTIQETKLLHRTHRQPLRVGYIGTLAQHKGCHVLIEAFNALPNGLAVLSIYGNTKELPEYSSELRRLADNNNAITFCGTFHNSKIGEILANIDVLVVPSLWYENTPLVVYSAQAAYCPVIASNFPGISAIIQDQVNGLLFEAGNIKALSKQLSRLMYEPKLITQLSINSVPPKSTASYVDELLSVWINK